MKIRRKIWLIGVWIFKIWGAKSHFKVPFYKKIYYNFHGFTKDQIALYQLNFKNKDEYLSEFDWYKSRAINGKYASILNDKLIFTELIKKYAKTPEVYIIKKDKIFLSPVGYRYNFKEVIELLKKKKNVFLKPISLGKGRGILRIDYKKEFFINYEKTSLKDLEKILKIKTDYFICEAIKEAKYLSKIYDKTANTIRVITVRDKGKVSILHAVQRIGVKSTIPVDNGSKGALISKIDLDSGALSAARDLHTLNVYKNHPDTNAKIEGVVTPNIDKIKAFALTLMNKFPYLKFVAWDFLVTDKDIYVIEGNASSGINIIQVFGGEKNRQLGEFFRKNIK